MKILVLSHGSLASVLIDTAKMILGEIDDVCAIELLEGADIDLYQQYIRAEIDSAKEILVLTDLLGGSPFITTCKIYNSLVDNYKMRLVTGVNLPMLLEVLNVRDGCSLEELATVANEFGKRGIVDFVKQLDKERRDENCTIKN